VSDLDGLRQRWALYLTTVGREETRRELQVRLVAGDWGGVTFAWLELERLIAWGRELVEFAQGAAGTGTAPGRGTTEAAAGRAGAGGVANTGEAGVVWPREDCRLEISERDGTRRIVLTCRAAETPAEMLVRVELGRGTGAPGPGASGWAVDLELRALRVDAERLGKDIELLERVGQGLYLPVFPTVRALRVERPTGDMFCRHCHYDLRNLPELRCPECGAAYDPLDVRTYLSEVPNPTRRMLERIGIIIVIALIAAALIMLHAGPLGVLGGSGH
jgi:hypothetical protein